jgi:hypothetical protein
MRATSALLLALVLAALTGCSSDSATRERQAVVSWTAAARMIAQSWLDGAVPRTYARQALQTAARELGARRADTSTAERERVAGIVNELGAAVEREDRDAVRRGVDRL